MVGYYTVDASAFKKLTKQATIEPVCQHNDNITLPSTNV